MTGGTGETVVASRRRVVVRPRLIRALDGATARVRMLIAPAGYGKTTLAEQWIAAGDRPVAWYGARNASADVAVLSAGLAQIAASIIPGCDSRLRERLTSTQSPADDVAVLAEMLAEDLESWPSDAWLVIDDYERLCRAAEAEEFVNVLVASAPVNLLVAGRQRPAWVSSRNILYGEVFELGQTGLAMTLDEAEEVLSNWPPAQASGLTHLAEGWPAVVGLAGLTSAPDDIDADVPAALYEFFAEEVYEGLSWPAQEGLGLLAIAPVLDRDLAIGLLGAEACDAVCSEAMAIGVLEDRMGRLELHPLARGFLEARMPPTAASGQAVESILASYVSRHDWDAAFDLVERQRLLRELDALMEAALEDLLNGARLATLETWIQYAIDRGRDGAIYRVARAELSLRRGRHTAARTLAESTVSELDVSPQLACRALLVAGRAAHIACREADALSLYEHAEVMATTDIEKKHAQWGQVMCAAALEREEAHDLLNILRAETSTNAPLELVRMADRRLSVGFRFGVIDGLEEAREIAELLEDVRDPVARCSFRSTLSGALSLSANYSLARDVANSLLQDAIEHRIEIAEPYARALLAQALGGLHEYEVAYEFLLEAEAISGEQNDRFGVANVYSIRTRLLVQERRFAEACANEPPAPTADIPSIEGEAIATRGLALACIGRSEEAEELARIAGAHTSAIEARVLTRAITAIAAVNRRAPHVGDAAYELTAHAFDSGGFDLFATAYRASSELLDVLLSLRGTRERALFALKRTGDELLARDLGKTTAEIVDPVSSLTAREREVYDLVAQGFTNNEIAKRLFISQATVKAHLHHIFDKLDIRSRTALALYAATRRN